MRNHKQFKFWDNLIQLLVRSYRFASTLPANDQYALGAEIKRLTVRCRMSIVDAGACEAALDCARSLELAYRQVKELGSCIEFAAELGLTKPELVDDLIQSGDRMAGAIFRTVGHCSNDRQDRHSPDRRFDSRAVPSYYPRRLKTATATGRFC